ncbi:MAG: hypothetical protein ABI821_07150 [Pseudomonadota bacterium]
MRNISGSFADSRGAFVPTEFQEMVDVADCALDEQLEQLHRRYAAASRASSKARFELELLEGREGVPAHMLAQAQRQRAAAETRSNQLLRAIDALEERMEDA